MKKLSVLNLIGINPNKLGALEEYALSISKELIQRGYFAAVGFIEYPPPWLMQKFVSAKIEVLKFNYENGRIHFIQNLRKAILKYRFNILHVTFYDIYSPDFIIATALNSCKLFYSDQYSRDSHPIKGVKSIFPFLRNRLCQRFIHTIIADAEFIKKCHVQDHFEKPEKIKVIYNGVNLNRFRISAKMKWQNILSEFSISDNSSIIVTIAHCSWVKGLNYFLDAAKIVIKQRPDSIFIIIGDGPERHTLVRQAANLGLSDKCIFTGIRTDTEVFLAAADIFVLLSVWEEAFSFSLLEAMASGCPVVATDIGAIPESVKNGVTGILVPPRDAEAAGKAILNLLNDEPLRLKMGIAARERIEKNFPLENWVNQTIDLYENAINHSRT